MSLDITRFPAPLEAQFRASRMAALAQINGTTYWMVAMLVLVFIGWDRFVDPVNWKLACVIRCIGALVILATGVAQRASGRVDFAPMIARVRFAASVIAVAAALAVLERGYLVGLAGLVAVLLSAPYIALDRRDILVLNAVPLAATALIMYLAGLDRFEVINASVFLVLAVAVSLLLARVFESSNRRAFALEQAMYREARTDALTGLSNRRALEEIAGEALAHCVATATPLSVILCDVDHFKHVNDRHGHGAGDRVIRAIAERLRTVMRDSDSIGRWGGEEFLAILPNTREHEASLLAERLRAVVEASVLPIDGGGRVTVSLGVAELAGVTTAADDDWTRLVKAADDAMYRAKGSGRNRVVAAQRL